MNNRKVLSLLVAAGLVISSNCFGAADFRWRMGDGIEAMHTEMLNRAVAAGNDIFDTCGNTVVLQVCRSDDGVNDEVGSFLQPDGTLKLFPTELKIVQKKARELDPALRGSNGDTLVYTVESRAPHIASKNWFFIEQKPGSKSYSLTWQPNFVAETAYYHLPDSGPNVCKLKDSCQFKAFKDVASARAALATRSAGSGGGGGDGSSYAAAAVVETVTVDNTAEVMAAQGDVSTAIANFIAGSTTKETVFSKIQALRNAFATLAGQ